MRQLGALQPVSACAFGRVGGLVGRSDFIPRVSVSEGGALLKEGKALSFPWPSASLRLRTLAWDHLSPVYVLLRGINYISSAACFLIKEKKQNKTQKKGCKCSPSSSLLGPLLRSFLFV